MSTVAPPALPATIEGRGTAKGVPLGKAVERRRPVASLEGAGVTKKEWGSQKKSGVDKLSTPLWISQRRRIAAELVAAVHVQLYMVIVN